jgi:hypothetical protein
MDAQGRFAGLVVGFVPQAFLHALLGEAELEPDSFLWLEQADGTWLAGASRADGSSFSAALPWPESAPRDGGGYFRAHLDQGAEQLVSYRPVPGWPLRLVLMRSVASVEASWWPGWSARRHDPVAGGGLPGPGAAVRARTGTASRSRNCSPMPKGICAPSSTTCLRWSATGTAICATCLPTTCTAICSACCPRSCGASAWDVVGPVLMARHGPHVELALAGQAQTFEWAVRLPGRPPRTLLVSLAPDLREGVWRAFLPS